MTGRSSSIRINFHQGIEHRNVCSPMVIIAIKWIFGLLVDKHFSSFFVHLMNFSGCVMFEIITLRPLFPGSNELDQINKIHDVLGTPSPATLDKFQQ